MAPLTTKRPATAPLWAPLERYCAFAQRLLDTLPYWMMVAAVVVGTPSLVWTLTAVPQLHHDCRVDVQRKSFEYCVMIALIATPVGAAVVATLAGLCALIVVLALQVPAWLMRLWAMVFAGPDAYMASIADPSEKRRRRDD